MKKFSKNKNKILAGILGIFVFAISFLLSGCIPFPQLLGGDWISDLNEQLKNGEITQDEYDSIFKENSGGIELEGIKVLRRPTSYDYDANVIEDGKNYYYKYANDIFQTIYQVFCILNNTYEEPKNTADGTIIVPGETIFHGLANIENKENENLNILAEKYSANDDSMKYFYDALRYQVIDEVIMYVPKWKSEEGYYSNAQTQPDGYAINTDAFTESNLPSEVSITDENMSSYIEVTADLNKGWNWFTEYNNFQYDYFDTEIPEDIRSFIAMNTYSAKDPNGERYVITKNGNYVTNKFDRNYYNITRMKERYDNIAIDYLNKIVDNDTNEVAHSTAEDFSFALGYAIYCIVLGLTPSNVRWENNEFIVGSYEKKMAEDGISVEKSSAQVAFESIQKTFKQNGSYVGLTTRDKNNIAKYILNNVIGSDAQVYGKCNLYYEDIVKAVVNYCGTLTKIGTSTGGDTNVGNNFVASELIDFPGTSFFVSQNEEDEFEYINSHEYQSLLIMPKGETRITDIWLDFKYIARDGNVKLTDKSLYIDITVSINWWTGTEMKVMQQDIRVFNDSFNAGYEGSLLMFEFDVPRGFGEAVKIGKFECEELDVSKSDRKVVDEHTKLDKLVLNGFTNARLYYELVQNKEDSTTSRYGAYGKLNKDKISAEHPNMSYLEITFDVAKPSNNFDRNYDFYVGFSQFNDYTPDLSWAK